MYQKSLLNNGLRVVTSTMAHTRSVSIGVFVATGSRYESDAEAGVSHFIEHLCFKGTHRRVTSKELSEEIEGVGGMLNGGTDKELTVYWCKVARPHFSLAVDVLSDMLSNSRFDPKDVDRERQVIIEEINMSLDSPQQRVDTLIDELVWPAHPLGRDVAGSKASVSGLDRENILRYFGEHYSANNAVVSVAGGIDHQEVVDKIEETFSSWQEGRRHGYVAVSDDQSEPRSHSEHRDIEQVHLCLALPALSLNHPDRFALDLLNVILGEGMSSRLFVEIREKLGLAYAVHSYVNHHLDTGSLGVYAGVDPTHLSTTIRAILEQLHHLKDRVPAEELTKAKELSKGRLLLRMEDTRSVAGWLGGQELLLGKILTVDEVLSIVDAIQAEDLQRVAQHVLLEEKLNLAVVGPVEKAQFQGLLPL